MKNERSVYDLTAENQLLNSKILQQQNQIEDITERNQQLKKQISIALKSKLEKEAQLMDS